MTISTNIKETQYNIHDIPNMADITVDEVVDSLVKEIDNELENTISDSDQLLLPLTEKEKYQIPLQDIGNDTMELIVKYNTQNNGTKNDFIGGEIIEEEPIEEDLALNISEIPKEEDTVKEYTLADYDLSTGSIGTINTLNHDESDDESENEIDNENNKVLPNDEIVEQIEEVEPRVEKLHMGVESNEDDKIHEDSEQNILEREEDKTENENKESSSIEERETEFTQPILPTIPVDFAKNNLSDKDEAQSIDSSIPEKQEENISEVVVELEAEQQLNKSGIDMYISSSNHSVDDIDDEPIMKPLSTIIGLSTVNAESKIKLPSVEDSFNSPDYVEINRSFGLPDVVYQEPIVMTTIFEDGASTMTENSPPSKNIHPNDYLSIWHLQNSGDKALNTNKRITSPALSSHSKFSDGTIATLVNSAHDQPIEPSPKASHFSFKPRLVSRSKVSYSSSSSNSSRVSSGGAKPLVIPQNSQPFSRISSLGTDAIYSNGEYAFMGEVVDTSIDFTKDNPLDFTFNINDDISKLNSSFALAPETSLIKNITEHNQTSKGENSIENLEESLSTIIDFDKPNVLSNYLENELGAGFGDFLYIIDKENSANLKDNKDETNIIDLDCVSEAKSVRSNTDKDAASIADETILFEHFEPVSPVKITETRQLANTSHTQSPIKVVGQKDHKQSIQLITNELNDAPKVEYIEPFKEDSIMETGSSIEEVDNSSQIELSKIKVSRTEKEVVPAIISEPLPDEGKLYISFESLSFLDLEAVESHKAKFSIQCKMGDNRVTTPYEKLTNRHLDMKKDMALTLSEEFLNNDENRLEILVKCNYEKVKTELVPMKEKVQVGKKHLFRKTKYIYKTRYVQRSLETDRWDHLFGPNGEYCKGSHNFTKEELRDLKFNKKSITISLKNDWAKGLNPYEVISLRIKVSHISRTSKDEILPSSLRVANQILEKYKKQQNITKCGYMVQDGGDLSGKIQRRYYELNGNVLTACHETSHKPQLLINLLNVKTVAGYDNYNEDDQRKFTNFTDMILLNECIQLVFDNGEVISFNVEGGEEEKSDWFMKINEVIQLNVAHQPWVKQLLREEELKSQ